MESKFKVIVFTPVWGRHEILELCAEGVKRIQKYAPEYIEIEPFCMVSNDEDEALIQYFGFPYIRTENKPLGRKHNAGLEALRSKDFDYILQLGSDDLITDRYLNYAYTGMCLDWDLFGVTKLYFCEPESKRACMFSLSTQESTLIGAGRFISHRAIEKLNYKLWPDSINRGLDMTSQANLATIGVSPKILNLDHIGVMDVKSDTNIWPYETFGRLYPKVEYLEAIKEFPEL